MTRWEVGAGVALAALVALVAIVTVRGADGDAAPQPPLDIAVVGDSFAEQSADQMVEQASEHGLTAEVSAFGGSSMCTWESKLAEYARRRPRILVLSFAGNDLQPCFNPTCVDTDGDGEPDCQVRDSRQVADLYRDELEAVLAQFEPAGSAIYVVLPPPVRHLAFEERAAAMRDMYHQAIEDHPDLGLIDPATRLDPQGQGWVERLPCEDWDDDCGPDGQVVVRQDDGIHLTPAGGERYARAVFDQLDL